MRKLLIRLFNWITMGRVSNALNALQNVQQRLSGLENRLNAIEGNVQNIEQGLNDVERKSGLALEELSSQIESHALGSIRRHRAIKQNFKMPFTVVFLCELPAAYNSFKALVEACEKDAQIQTIIVITPNKKYSPDGSFTYVYEDFTDIIDYDSPNVKKAYCEATNTWLDLKSLSTDYFFYQRPYDYYRYEEYHIKVVCNYSKTCCIPYYGIGLKVGNNIINLPIDFLSKLDFYFAENDERAEHFRNRIKKETDDYKGRIITTGSPRLDLSLKSFEKEEYNQLWKKDGKNGYRILWAPRWSTSEGNCHFFDYKSVLLNYAMKHKDIELLLRPHPMMFDNFIFTGEMSETEVKEFKDKYNGTDNVGIDETADYRTALYTADCLVADETSLIAEFFLTGKPIVFCKKITHFNALSERLSKGMYIVSNENELISTFNSLVNGEDNLKEKRQSIAEKEFPSRYRNAVNLIKNILKDDFYGNDYLQED
ncbi:MAG: hypothetical protein GX222_05610 [Ruminococcaceae bacterium]|nr:hypothetical protein [Oscillospiraceae bacterium]